MRYFGVVILVVAAAALLIGVCWLLVASTRTPTMRLMREATKLKKESARLMDKGHPDSGRLLSKTADDIITYLKAQGKQ